MLGECKYSNKKVGIDILEALKNKTKYINSSLPISKYLLFSKSGFTDELINISKNNENILLIEKLELLK